MKQPKTLPIAEAAPLGIGFEDRLCCVGASLPSQKFGAWIVDEIRGTRVRLVSGNLKADKWLSLEVVESMLQLVKQHNQRGQPQPRRKP
jgi:hypothetical protein